MNFTTSIMSTLYFCDVLPRRFLKYIAGAHLVLYVIYLGTCLLTAWHCRMPVIWQRCKHLTMTQISHCTASVLWASLAGGEWSVLLLPYSAVGQCRQTCRLHSWSQSEASNGDKISSCYRPYIFALHKKNVRDFPRSVTDVAQSILQNSLIPCQSPMTPMTDVLQDKEPETDCKITT